MKKRLLTLAATLGLCVSAYAFPVSAQTGIYVNFGPGWNKLNNANTLGIRPNASTQKTDKSSFMWLAGIGYQYALSNHFTVGFEGDFLNLGYKKFQSTVGASNYNVRFTQMGVAGLLTASVVMDHLTIGLKYGPAKIRQKLFTNGSGFNSSELGTFSHTATLWVGQADIGWLFPTGLDISMAYLRTFRGNSSNNTSVTANTNAVANSQAYVLDIKYLFPM